MEHTKRINKINQYQQQDKRRTLEGVVFGKDWVQQVKKDTDQ
jgi:hypothetical protein